MSFVAMLSPIGAYPLLTDNQILPVALAGSAHPDESVARKGEDALKRLREVDVEEPKLMHELMTRFLGTKDSKTIPASKQRQPASEAYRLRLLTLLSKSQLVANQGALTLKLIFECLFAPTSTRRLQLSSLQLLCFVFRCASTSSLEPLATVYLQGLLRLLMLCKPQQEAPSESSSSSSSSSASDSLIAHAVRASDSAVGGNISSGSVGGGKKGPTSGQINMAKQAAQT